MVGKQPRVEYRNLCSGQAARLQPFHAFLRCRCPMEGVIELWCPECASSQRAESFGSADSLGWMRRRPAVRVALFCGLFARDCDCDGDAVVCDGCAAPEQGGNRGAPLPVGRRSCLRRICVACITAAQRAPRRRVQALITRPSPRRRESPAGTQSWQHPEVFPGGPPPQY